MSYPGSRLEALKRLINPKPSYVERFSRWWDEVSQSDSFWRALVWGAVVLICGALIIVTNYFENGGVREP